MRKLVMNMAWELKRKGFGTMSECMKKAWNLVKQLDSATKQISKEKALSTIKSLDRRTIQTAMKSGLMTFNEYLADAKVSYDNLKVWTKGNVARLYADVKLDGLTLTQKFFA